MPDVSPDTQPDPLTEDIERLISTIVTETDLALRFILMMGLLTSLPRHEDGQIDVSTAAVRGGAQNLVVELFPARFDRGDGAFILVDGSQQLPRLELLWLIDEIAAVSDESTRRAAFRHVVITTLADADWVSW